ncbi:MAG: chemotaxis response regulator protein-glutamate methylesterase [Bryobacteraceae bacterium]|nr:chemotaxis response regulator protein-glutamate methylesterase [Bryobacteraceae bacterium]
MTSTRKIKVLIVDDSAIVRRILSDALSGHDDLEVIGTAPDPFVARDKILALRPDVLTLDIEMPRMDGITFLQKLMHFRPMPVIVISSLGQASCQSAIDALRAGAVEVLAKPGGPYSVGDLKDSLAQKIRAAAVSRVRRPASTVLTPLPSAPPVRAVPVPDKGFGSSAIIAIGASTGGTEAVESVLLKLPANSPGIVVVQHIPAGFSLAFANRLNRICPMEVKEAVEGDVVRPGRALIAPGDFHMVLCQGSGGYYVSVRQGPRVCYQRPAVDVLFDSVAEVAGGNAVAALLTGMGSDGAKGMLRMKTSGAWTIAQDEATCVVFGMPREAIQMGAALQVCPLPAIPGAILRALEAKTRDRALRRKVAV